MPKICTKLACSRTVHPKIITFPRILYFQKSAESASPELAISQCPEFTIHMTGTQQHSLLHVNGMWSKAEYQVACCTNRMHNKVGNCRSFIIYLKTNKQQLQQQQERHHAQGGSLAERGRWTNRSSQLNWAFQAERLPTGTPDQVELRFELPPSGGLHQMWRPVMARVASTLHIWCSSSTASAASPQVS